MDTTIARKKDLGPLHDLLLESCPPDGKDVQSISHLAELLDLSAFAIYKWIDKGSISGKRAREIVALPGCSKSLEDFLPYIM